MPLPFLNYRRFLETKSLNRQDRRFFWENWEYFDSYYVIDKKRRVEKKRLEELMKQAHKEFYFRPKRILVEMYDISPSNITNKIWTFKEFLKLYVMPKKDKR